MPWFHAVAERDHAIQNPTSPDKIRRLGEHLRLDAQSNVLDVACGRGGPAVILAENFGCRIVTVERAAEFAGVARERVLAAGVEPLVEVVESDARDFPLSAAAFDAALCLGGSFIWDGLYGTLAALTPAVRPGGYVVVGEPFRSHWPLPRGVDDQGFTSVLRTTRKFEAADLSVVSVIASSQDDWDAYESLHWRSLEEWLAEHDDDPDADEIRRRHREARDAYLGSQRELLAWAIVIGWKVG